MVIQVSRPTARENSEVVTKEKGLMTDSALKRIDKSDGWEIGASPRCARAGIRRTFKTRRERL